MTQPAKVNAHHVWNRGAVVAAKSMFQTPRQAREAVAAD